MVKKSWNIVNLRKRLIDNQSTKIKNKIAVKVIKLTSTPDLIITRIDLGREKYHKLDFEINLPPGSHLEITILGPHSNILAHGISSGTLLSIAFQTSYDWISVEIKARMQRLNLYFYINRILQNSCVSIPVDPKFLLDTKELLRQWRDSGNESDVIHKGANTGDNQVSQEELWYLLPDLPIWKLCLAKISSMDAYSHTGFLLKNRGNMLLRTFVGNKKLRQNLCDKDVWAPLIFSLPLAEHYRHCHKNYLEKFCYVKEEEEGESNIATDPPHLNQDELTRERQKLTHQFEDLIRQLASARVNQEELTGEIELCKEERLTRIAEVEILRERIMPDLENNNYYREIIAKKQVLESLKDHLMKDLLRQHNVKKVSEALMKVANSDASKQACGEREEACGQACGEREALENHNKGILMAYNLLGGDLLKIEKELKKVNGIKERLENNHGDVSNIEDYDSLLKDIEERTAIINAMTESLMEISLGIENAKSRRWALFHSYLENIIKSKLATIYRPDPPIINDEQ